MRWVGETCVVTSIAQWRAPTTCDLCPHPIGEHILWEPDTSCDGWMHCGAEGCTTWHDWPKLKSEPSPQ